MNARAIVASSCFFVTGMLFAAAAHAGPSMQGGGSCSIGGFHTDSDGDGLYDCYETGTGVYASPTDTGTDPLDPDTDGDGLLDGDEVNGTADGLDLPSFGVSPVHKDILLEYDWMEDATDCPMHSHRPSPAALAIVRDMFADAPVSNPDGAKGIHVYQDRAPSLNPNGASNEIPDADGLIDGGVGGTDYINDEQANFPPNRLGYFHYVIFAHAYTANYPSYGQATYGAHRMLVTTRCDFLDTSVAYSTIHELGHNLWLDHGGPIDVNGLSNIERSCNNKPNYNSLMNYRFSILGLVDCSMTLNHRAGFSSGTRRTLDENDVYEPDGVCLTPNAPPVDWNGHNGIEYTHYAYPLNPGAQPGCPLPPLSVLHDYDDWSNMDLTRVTDFGTADVSVEQ
ncbi:MAG TPA: hypothetical protein VJ696_02250 [Rhodanobacteraceae bacterium]|nr:hypothetical protein [Rhodanobacteraceae bacterium]